MRESVQRYERRYNAEIAGEIERRTIPLRIDRSFRIRKSWCELCRFSKIFRSKRFAFQIAAWYAFIRLCFTRSYFRWQSDSCTYRNVASR